MMYCAPVRYGVPVVVGKSNVPIPLPFVTNYQPASVMNRPAVDLYSNFAMVRAAHAHTRM